MIIDLRSDTVTKPTKEMLDAILSAKVGDDVYKEDETVNLLEERVATMFGKSKALFFPTGTMANQTALKLHTNPGDQIIADKDSHIYNYEGGGASFNSGVSFKLIDGDRGMFNIDDVLGKINPPDFYHSPLTTLVCVENTTNKGGGRCYEFENLKDIKKVVDKHGLKYHLDGARLWNAIVENNEDPKQYGKLFDTISLCFSKGLGTPLGTVLIGSNEAMENAIRIRKILGGGMRQIGYIAAAGLYALDHHLERLKQDHQRAKEIAEVLSKLDYVKKVEPTQTNIVIFYLKDSLSENQFIEDLRKMDVIISSMGQGKLRIVTHLDYTDEMHTRFLEILKKYTP